MNIYYGSTTLAHISNLEKRKKVKPGGIYFHTQSSLLALNRASNKITLFSDHGQRLNLLSYYKSICNSGNFAGYMHLSNSFQDRHFAQAYSLAMRREAFMINRCEQMREILVEQSSHGYFPPQAYGMTDVIYQFNWRDARTASHLNRPNHFYLIYDLIALKYPEYISSNSDVPVYLTNLLSSIKSRHNIVVSSNTTKIDILNYFPHILPHQIHVVNLASDERRFARSCSNELLNSCLEKLAIPHAPYFLCTSTLEPRKNMLSVIQAFKQFCQKFPESTINLVLVGSQGWGGEPEKIFDEIKEKSGRIFATGFISDSMLSTLYSHCQGFIFPSFDEGFGMPVIEAMSCGAPIITSNISSMWEIGEGYAIGVNPYSTQDLLEGMIRLTKSDEVSHFKERSLLRSLDYSWSKHANALLDLYSNNLY